MEKSWLDRFEGSILDKINWVRLHRVEDVEKADSICDELISYGKEQNDPALIGSAYYYKGEISYLRLHISEAISELDLGLRYLKNSDAPRMYANAFNTIGSIHLQSSSYITAMDYYLRGVDVCKKHNYMFTLGMFYCNMSSLYISLKNYQEALTYLPLALECFEKEQETPTYYYHCVISSRTMMANAYIQTNRFDEAKENLHLIKKLMEEHPDANWDWGNYYHALVLYAAKTNDDALMIDSVLKFHDYFSASPSKTDMLSSMVSVIDSLEQQGRLDLLYQMEDTIREFMDADVPPSIRMILLRVCWHMTEDKTSKEAQFLMEDLLKTYEQEKAYTDRTNSAAIHRLIHRNEIFQDSEKWMMMANKDTLTGLWNRRYFDTLFQSELEKAIPEKTSIAVGMLDIDYFKEYNDNYGHIQGDYCIQQISALFSQISDEHLTFARYGGDEFLVLAVGYTKEVLEKRIQHMFKSLTQLNILHQYSPITDHVTISLGIIYHQDAGDIGDKATTLVDKADELLYQVKKAGKNAFLVKEAIHD